MEKSGGRPKTKTTGYEKTKPLVLKNDENKKTKTKPNYNVNENENVNVNVNDNYNNANDSCVDGLQESDSCIDGFLEQNIVDFWHNNIGTLSPYTYEILLDYQKEMGKDLVLYAMQISVEANKRTIQYIKAILNNWKKAGIKTLIEAKEESKKTKTKEKSSNINNHTQREYSNLDKLYAN